MPSQASVALLERIIQASSNEGDAVLDPRCRMRNYHRRSKVKPPMDRHRHHHLSIALQKYRLKDAFGLEPVGKRVNSPSVSSPSVSSPHVSKGNAPYTRAKDAPVPSQETDPTDLDAGDPVQPGAENPNVALTHVRATDTAAPAAAYRIIGEPWFLPCCSWRFRLEPLIYFRERAYAHDYGQFKKPRTDDRNNR